MAGKRISGGPKRVPGAQRAKIRDTRGRFVKGGTGVAWENLDVITSNIAKTAEGCHEARLLSAQNLSKSMETYAKENAPWEDDTGEAREGLKTVVVDRPGDFVSQVHLGHTAEYGIYLETRNGGEFAIIAPTIAEFGMQVQDTIVGLGPLARKINI